MASKMMRLSLLVMCLLVCEAHGARRVLPRSSGDGSPSWTACPPVPSGFRSGNRVPVVHRLSPCFPLGAAQKKQGKPSPHEVFHRDGLRRRYLSEVHAAAAATAAAAAPAPAPSSSVPSSGMSVAVKQNVFRPVPGVFEYTVLAGYGTPAQQLPFYFDYAGVSNVRCQPCVTGPGAAPCGLAFDPSQSSTLQTVPCGAPECAEAESSCSPSGSSSSPCTIVYQYNSTVVFSNGTMVTDTLTLSPSAAFEGVAAGCLQYDDLFTDGLAVGNIDLSRTRLSLATRALLSSPPGTAAFSYCLPADTDTHGFLTIGPDLSDYAGLPGVKVVPLVANPAGTVSYYVDLVAIAVNGKDIPLPEATFRENGTVIEWQSAFSYFSPPIYAALRDEFRSAMVKYPPAPEFSGLDTCYNFTGIDVIELPDMALRFGNEETMDLDDRQFMYFFREHLNDDFPFGCLAFAELFAVEEGVPNYLGTQLQRTKEIVFDVRGGQVAFVPSRCGLR